MASEYLVNLYDTAGTKVAIFDSWVSLNFSHSLNRFSTHQLILNGSDARISLFTKDSILEVMRRNTELGIDWYAEYTGFHRTPQRQITETGKRLFTSYGRGLLDLLNRRNILYYAASIGASKAGAAEDVIKAYVGENAGSAASSPTRLRPGTISGLSVAASAGLGISWTGARAHRNLLDVITEIAQMAGLVFDIIRTGLATFEFRVTIARDRTNAWLDPLTGLNIASNVPVIFAPELANMATPSFTNSATEEITTIITLGQGQEDDREFNISQSIHAFDSPWNDIEDVRDARQESTLAGLISQGEEALQTSQARENFNCNIIQTAATAYGRDYFLSDLIVAKFEELELQKQIVQISISIADGEEKIGIELGDIPNA